MSLLISHIPRIKTRIKLRHLSSVSWPSLQIGYGGVLGEVAEYEGGSSRVYGVHLFLVWLRLWLSWLCGGQSAPLHSGQNSDELNRHYRRLNKRIIKCSLPAARNLSPFYVLCRKGMNRQQFLEKLCRLSLLGRVAVYRIPSWGSVLRRRAMLVCYDHGWWRAPVGKFGRIYAGLWPIFVWVNWHKLQCVHILGTISKQSENPT